MPEPYVSPHVPMSLLMPQPYVSPHAPMPLPHGPLSLSLCLCTYDDLLEEVRLLGRQRLPSHFFRLKRESLRFAPPNTSIDAPQPAASNAALLHARGRCNSAFFRRDSRPNPPRIHPFFASSGKGTRGARQNWTLKKMAWTDSVPRPLARVLPSAVTLAALCCGVSAIRAGAFAACAARACGCARWMRRPILRILIGIAHAWNPVAYEARL